jgi:hypothetical protein
MKPRLTFAQLCKLNPDLRYLEEDIAIHVRDFGPTDKDDTYCANRWWYGYDEPCKRGAGFRGRMKELVGISNQPEPDQ